jgi:hypothetical protein
MSAPELFDPLEGPSGGWPDAAEMERAYLEAFAQAGSQALISNLRTRALGLASGGRVFPVTVNDAEYGDAYVCLPHTAYSLYAKAELGIVDVGPGKPALGLVADIAGALLKAAAVNRIVHLGNWMLSTNLHGGWRGEGLDAMRDQLIARFPDHLLAVRSVNAWSDPELLEALRARGWRLTPARQVYVTDDLERDWAPRKDTRRDLKLMARTPLRLERLESLGPGDARRIAELYDLLYLQRYSRLNPAFTPAFIEMTCRRRILDYAGFRDEDGRLVAVVGCFTRGGVLTTPIVGYDTRQPRELGLYRLASALLARMAQQSGARLNGSAGAASFKRLRGARPVIEYTAYFIDHLSAPRRAVMAGLERLLNAVVVPIMQERGL